MIFEINISDQADKDLRNIYEYIAFKLQSPENASGQFDRLEKGIMGLSQIPERFRRYEKEPWYGRGLHVMSVDNYCVFYIVDLAKSVVTVIRVMYGAQDFEIQLNKFTNQ